MEKENKIANEFNLSDVSKEELFYIENRLLPQIRWYTNKSKQMKKCYNIMSIVSFSLSALIPFVVLFSNVFL